MADIDSGPPGVEVPHRWDNAITLNDLTARPRIKVDKITGWFSLAEADDNREPRTARRGEIPRPSYARGKTLVYDGSVQGRSLDTVVARMSDLRNAFRDRNSSRIMLLLGEQEWVFLARVMQFDGDSSHAEYNADRPLPWRIPFTFGLRMEDARYYAYPQVGGGGPIAAGTAQAYSNLGPTETEPTFTVTVSAGANIDLQNLTLGLNLKFLALPAGTLVVDFGHRTAMIGAVEVSPKIDDVNSNWWDEGKIGVAPGSNNLKVVGGIWSVSFLHASE